MSNIKAKGRLLMLLGIALIIVTGLVHAIDAPDSFGDAAYKGWLFCLNAAGAAAAAWGIARSRVWGWNLGLVIAAGSVIAYVLSRTVGLPYIPAEPDNWLEPLGVVAVGAELLFTVVFFLRGKR